MVRSVALLHISRVFPAKPGAKSFWVPVEVVATTVVTPLPRALTAIGVVSATVGFPATPSPLVTPIPVPAVSVRSAHVSAAVRVAAPVPVNASMAVRSAPTPGPVGPIEPVAPVAPGGPCGPVGPTAPGGPCCVPVPVLLLLARVVDHLKYAAPKS